MNIDKLKLKLYHNDKEICESKINYDHITKSVHSKEEIIAKLLERLTNYLELQVFDNKI